MKPGTGNAADRLKSSIDQAKEALDPNDLWNRSGDRDPRRVSLPSHPMKCVAILSNGSRACRKWAIPGANVCGTHGGSAPQVKAAAARRLEQVKTMQDLTRRVEHAADFDPVEAIETELARASVMTEALTVLVSDLGLGDTEGGSSIVVDGDQHPFVKWMNEERDRKVKISKIAHDIGITDRAIRVQERHVSLIAAVISATFDDPELGLDDHQRVAARQVFGRRLRALPTES